MTMFPAVSWNTSSLSKQVEREVIRKVRTFELVRDLFAVNHFAGWL